MEDDNVCPKFRDYKKASEGVRDFYRQSRQKQTVEYVQKMHKWYREHKRQELDSWDALMLLAQVNDASDPDLSISNIHHSFQVAESFRQRGAPEWLQVVGLIHDMGKILYLISNDPEAGTSLDTQWGVVGDTFIVGCQIPETAVYSEFNNLNPDSHDPRYNTKCGMYQPETGLDNVLCSWGHDEYMYRVLIDNRTVLSNIEPALYMIRYHSLYPWHQKNEYEHLLSPKDKEMLSFVRELNKHDLYTKEDREVEPEELKEYYYPLIKQYLGHTLLF